MRLDGHRFSTPRDYFHHQYFQACDLLIQELEDMFEQQDLLPPIQCLESLPLKAANGEVYEEKFQSLKSSCYSEDIRSATKATTNCS